MLALAASRAIVWLQNLHLLCVEAGCVCPHPGCDLVTNVAKNSAMEMSLLIQRGGQRQQVPGDGTRLHAGGHNFHGPHLHIKEEGSPDCSVDVQATMWSLLQLSM